jgi:MerR family transcriptional regulator/heat shock protein HspR
MYEREGFVCPRRINRQRLYSDEDVRRLNLVIQLTKDMGVNRAGVDIILRMRKRMEAMQKEMMNMMDLLDGEAQREFEKRLKKMFSGDKE